MMALVESSPSFVSLKVTNSLSSAASEKRYPTSETIGDLKVGTLLPINAHQVLHVVIEA